MEQRYRRGDIYLAELRGCVGSEQRDFCPVIIIQNDISNIHSPTVIVVPLIAQNRKKNDLPTHSAFWRCTIILPTAEVQSFYLKEDLLW